MCLVLLGSVIHDQEGEYVLLLKEGSDSGKGACNEAILVLVSYTEINYCKAQHPVSESPFGCVTQNVTQVGGEILCLAHLTTLARTAARSTAAEKAKASAGTR